MGPAVPQFTLGERPAHGWPSAPHTRLFDNEVPPTDGTDPTQRPQQFESLETLAAEERPRRNRDLFFDPDQARFSTGRGLRAACCRTTSSGMFDAGVSGLEHRRSLTDLFKVRLGV